MESQLNPAGGKEDGASGAAGVPEGGLHRGNRDRAAFALARPVRPRRLKSPPGPPRMNACSRLPVKDYGNFGGIEVAVAVIRG